MSVLALTDFWTVTIRTYYNFHYPASGNSDYVNCGYNWGSNMTQILSIKSATPEKTVNVTDAAVEKIRELVEAEGDAGLALRMAVRPGGCSGFSYEMYFDAETDATDIVEAYGDVRVIVDPQSAEMVKGSTLDYKDGLMGAGFAIDNPNITASCGCGNSFS